MAVSDDYLHYVLDQLAALGHIASRRMFGGVGLYHDERFFALISRDTLYFKVNDTNRADYESRSMGRFQPYPDKPYLSFTYYEVPADILEDREELTSWARRSIAAALALAAEKRGRKRPAVRKPADREPHAAGKRSAARKQAQPRKGGTTAKRSTVGKRAPDRARGTVAKRTKR